jgi:hypothetical protein
MALSQKARTTYAARHGSAYALAAESTARTLAGFHPKINGVFEGEAEEHSSTALGWLTGCGPGATGGYGGPRWGEPGNLYEPEDDTCPTDDEPGESSTEEEEPGTCDPEDEEGCWDPPTGL